MPADVKERLIIALDLPNAAEARRMVERIGDVAGFYKVGLQLFATEGPQLVREIVQSGKKVFLDLKFHDIPNTVAGAVRSASELGVEMLTVHGAGGAKMLTAAVEAAQKAGGGSATKILAVTMLTSIGEADLVGLGFGGSGTMADQVFRLAGLARETGCHGIVASPQEVGQLRKQLGGAMLIVTPGIRAAGSPPDDQARTATAAEALRSGASHLVVGRPITSAPDPAKAAQTILDEMASQLSART